MSQGFILRRSFPSILLAASVTAALYVVSNHGMDIYVLISQSNEWCEFPAYGCLKSAFLSVQNVIGKTMIDVLTKICKRFGKQENGRSPVASTSMRRHFNVVCFSRLGLCIQKIHME